MPTSSFFIFFQHEKGQEILGIEVENHTHLRYLSNPPKLLHIMPGVLKASIILDMFWEAAAKWLTVIILQSTPNPLSKHEYWWNRRGIRRDDHRQIEHDYSQGLLVRVLLRAVATFRSDQNCFGCRCNNLLIRPSFHKRVISFSQKVISNSLRWKYWFGKGSGSLSTSWKVMENLEYEIFQKYIFLSWKNNGIWKVMKCERYIREFDSGRPDMHGSILLKYIINNDYSVLNYSVSDLRKYYSFVPHTVNHSIYAKRSPKALSFITRHPFHANFIDHEAGR